MIKFSIIIPILNEAKNIQKLANILKKELNNKFQYEIIFVDDNSRDGSDIILKELSKKYKNINFIIRFNKQPDLTKSCLTGIEKAKYKYILIMDGDLQHNPSDIPKLIKLLHKENLDIVIGSRNFLKVYESRSLNFLRYYASILIKKLIIFFSRFTKQMILKWIFLFQKKILYKKNYLEKDIKFFQT